MTKETKSRLSANLEKARAVLAEKRAKGLIQYRAKSSPRVVRRPKTEARERAAVVAELVAARRVLAREADRLEARAKTIRDLLDTL